MIRFLSGILMMAIGAVIVVFVVVNRAPVVVDLWPVAAALPPLPLYVPLLVAAFIGFLGGGLVAWFSAGSARHRARAEARRADKLERDLDKLRERTESEDDANRTAGAA